jgi:hypothetical protein
MESKSGSKLTFISSILNYIFAGFVFLLGLIFSIVIFSGVGEIEGNISRQATGLIVLAIFIIVSVIFLILGLLFNMASKKMLNPKTTKNGAIWALILGIITLGNIAGILAVIGGAIALGDSDK